jgi:HSP20 family protein
MLNTAFSTDIRQTLDHFRRSVDQLFDNFNGYPADRAAGTRSETSEWTFSPVLETAWTDNSVHLRAILPGVRQNEVTVNVQGNQLLISGERKAPETFNRNAFTQLAYGKFSTSVTLPSGLDVDNVKCQLHDGILDIEIPVAESMKPRQIPIESGSHSHQKTINA